MYEQPEKVYSLDTRDYMLVVAMANRQVFIYDIRNMKETLQRRESSLKYMTRIVKCMPDGKGKLKRIKKEERESFCLRWFFAFIFNGLRCKSFSYLNDWTQNTFYIIIRVCD